MRHLIMYHKIDYLCEYPFKMKRIIICIPFKFKNTFKGIRHIPLNVNLNKWINFRRSIKIGRCFSH